MNAQRRLEPAQNGGPAGPWFLAARPSVVNCVVAEQKENVRLQGIGAFDDPREMIDRKPGLADMRIGQNGNAKREVLWPA